MAPAAESSVMESDQEKGQVDPDRVGDRAEDVEQSQDHPVCAHRIGVVDDYLVEACLPVQKNGRNIGWTEIRVACSYDISGRGLPDQRRTSASA